MSSVTERVRLRKAPCLYTISPGSDGICSSTKTTMTHFSFSISAAGVKTTHTAEETAHRWIKTHTGQFLTSKVVLVAVSNCSSL